MDWAEMAIYDGVESAFSCVVTNPTIVGQQDTGLTESVACVILYEVVVATCAENSSTATEPTQLRR